MINLDVLVIGGGTAGNDAARAARRNVPEVGLAEQGKVGGDCIFHACIPTKALIHAGRRYKEMKGAGFFGLPVSRAKVDYKKVKAFKDGIIAEIGTGGEQGLVKAGIRFFPGQARFVSPHEVAVGDTLIRAEQVIIATGSLPAVPPIPGLEEAGYLTSSQALELEEVPASLAVLGGGAVGVEFAQIFAAFGSRVHIYEAKELLLPGEDEEISDALPELFARQGIRVSASVTVTQVSATGAGKLVTSAGAEGQENSEEYQEVLVATGRKPAIDDLNLSAAGVLVSNRGILVNDLLQTNVPHIWAAGDVNGMYPFTFVAWEQGEVAGNNATSQKRRVLDYRVLPHVTFCDPEVASVGLTEGEARRQGYKVKTGKYDYDRLSLTMVTGEGEGFIKLVAEEGSGRILGGHIVGVRAGNLIHEVAVAVAGNLTASDIARTFHAFPTLSEGVRYACQEVVGQT